MICLGGDIWTECEEVEGSVIGSLTNSMDSGVISQINVQEAFNKISHYLFAQKEILYIIATQNKLPLELNARLLQDEGLENHLCTQMGIRKAQQKMSSQELTANF